MDARAKEEPKLKRIDREISFQHERYFEKGMPSEQITIAEILRRIKDITLRT